MASSQIWGIASWGSQADKQCHAKQRLLSMCNLTMRLTPRIAYLVTIKNADISLDHMKRYVLNAALPHWIISSDKYSTS